MTSYKIYKAAGTDKYGIVRESDIFPESVLRYFNGYSFMGDAEWEQNFWGDCMLMDLENAKATLADLQAAED